MAKEKRQPKDFNHSKPELTPNFRDITDPPGAEREAAGLPRDTEYPKHLVKHAGGGNREVVVARDAKHEAALRGEGYMTHHELDRVEPKHADAPAAPKKATKAKAGKK